MNEYIWSVAWTDKNGEIQIEPCGNRRGDAEMFILNVPFEESDHPHIVRTRID